MFTPVTIFPGYMGLTNHDSLFLSEIKNHRTEINTQTLTLLRQLSGTEMARSIKGERKDINTVRFILKLLYLLSSAS